MTTPSDHYASKDSPLTYILEQHIETAEREGPVPRPRVLIVEDHAETGLLMQYALREHGRTEVVATAGEALRKAASTTYDGFLIDINLRSRRNGIDVLEALRDDVRYRHAPMVAVTAHALPGDRQRFLAAGFDGYVSKPFSTEDLRAAMCRYIRPHSVSRTPSLDNVPAEL